MFGKDNKLRPNKKGFLFGGILTRFFANSPSGSEKLKQTDARLFARSLTIPSWLADLLRTAPVDNNGIQEETEEQI